MVLNELTGIATASLPLAELRDHLRLGTGFSDDSLQAGLLEGYLRASIAAIEGRIGKILITRQFSWTLECWRDDEGQALPVAPVSALTGLSVVDRDGVPAVIDPARYRLLRDQHRPKLVTTGSSLPTIPAGGTVEILFTAGFGTIWADVPVDLGQAVLLLAAQYYEHRHDRAGAGPNAAMSFGVMALIERWRTVRILGGGAA